MEEQFGRGRADRKSAEVHEEPVGGTLGIHQRPEEPERGALEVPTAAIGQVDLVGVARSDVVFDRSHTGLERFAVDRVGPVRAGEESTVERVRLGSVVHPEHCQRYRRISSGMSRRIKGRPGVIAHEPHDPVTVGSMALGERNDLGDIPKVPRNDGVERIGERQPSLTCGILGDRPTGAERRSSLIVRIGCGSRQRR